MHNQSNPASHDRPIPIEDDREAPNLNPIREDPETIEAPPRKKSIPIGEGSYEGSAQYAEGISNYLKNADVEADARAAAPATPLEAEALKQAEAEAAAHNPDLREY